MNTASLSWWIGQQPDGFTAFAAQQMRVEVPLDDVSDREFQIQVRRQEVLSALIGLNQSKRTAGIVAAQVVNRN